MSQLTRLGIALEGLTVPIVKQLFKTCEGMPNQFSAVAKANRKKGLPAATGHVKSNHVQGAKGDQSEEQAKKRLMIKVDTKFKSNDDAARSFKDVVTTPTNKAKIASLEPGKRYVAKAVVDLKGTLQIRHKDTGRTIPIPQKAREDLNEKRIEVVCVVEHRKRGDESHLHPVSVYPKPNKQQNDKFLAYADSVDAEK